MFSPRDCLSSFSGGRQLRFPLGFMSSAVRELRLWVARKNGNCVLQRSTWAPGTLVTAQPTALRIILNEPIFFRHLVWRGIHLPPANPLLAQRRAANHSKWNKEINTLDTACERDDIWCEIWSLNEICSWREENAIFHRVAVPWFTTVSRGPVLPWNWDGSSEQIFVYGKVK